jgi:hypothetical protein
MKKVEESRTQKKGHKRKQGKPRRVSEEKLRKRAVSESIQEHKDRLKADLLEAVNTRVFRLGQYTTVRERATKSPGFDDFFREKVSASPVTLSHDDVAQTFLADTYEGARIYKERDREQKVLRTFSTGLEKGDDVFAYFSRNVPHVERLLNDLSHSVGQVQEIELQLDTKKASLKSTEEELKNYEAQKQREEAEMREKAIVELTQREFSYLEGDLLTVDPSIPEFVEQKKPSSYKLNFECGGKLAGMVTEMSKLGSSLKKDLCRKIEELTISLMCKIISTDIGNVKVLLSKDSFIIKFTYSGKRSSPLISAMGRYIDGKKHEHKIRNEGKETCETREEMKKLFGSYKRNFLTDLAYRIHGVILSVIDSLEEFLKEEYGLERERERKRERERDEEFLSETIGTGTGNTAFYPYGGAASGVHFGSDEEEEDDDEPAGVAESKSSR